MSEPVVICLPSRDPLPPPTAAELRDAAKARETDDALRRHRGLLAESAAALAAVERAVERHRLIGVELTKARAELARLTGVRT